MRSTRCSLGCFALVAGEDVAVDLEGRDDVGVAEALADHPRVLAHGEEVGGVGVAEAVEGEVRHVGRADDVGEALADAVAVGVDADDGGEDVIRRLRGPIRDGCQCGTPRS